MVGEDGINTVERESDDSAVFISEFMHRCYQLLPLTCQNEIYSSATDFCHQAL